MPAGRKRKPTKLKKLAGNPGNHPLNGKEPEYPPAAGDPPSWFDNYSREEWGRVAKMLQTQGVLTSVDVASLEAYCVAYSRWRTAEEYLNKRKGTLVKKTKTGYLYTLPHVAIANKYAQQMRAWATEFGLTPAARGRIEGGGDGGGIPPGPVASSNLENGKRKKKRAKTAEERESEFFGPGVAEA